MELLTLARRLELGPLPPEESATIVIHVAERVAEWHRRGLLHRELFPASISLGATTEDIEVEEPSVEPILCGGAQWDAEKSPMELSTGTPLPIPRDLKEARSVLAAAQIKLDPQHLDIYQLGVLLNRLVTGESVTGYLSSPKVKSQVPADWRAVLDRALGYSRQGRLNSAEELIAALRASQPPTQIFGDTSPAENPSSTAGTPIPFTQIGDYELRGRIGHGGMGDFYQAHDPRNNRTVAIKVLPDELARHTDFVRRFYAEAASAARLLHPNIIEILYVGEDQGRHFFVMEYIAGESLAERLARQNFLSVDEAVSIARQVLAALHMAHDEGFVHRDIKPSNILLESDKRRAVLADFGLVKSLQETTGLTATGVVVGTVQYISPEQARGRMVDGRSDLYSLGVLFYQMLSGELPFTGESTTALIYQHVYEPPRPLIEVAPMISPVLGVIVDKLLAKSPEDRYPAAEQVSADLAAFIEGKPLPSGADIVDTEAPDEFDVEDTPGEATLIINAPKFEQAPVITMPEPPPEPVEQPEAKGWWLRIQQRLWDALRDQAPEFADSLLTTQQQLDGTLKDYENRERDLRILTKKALRMLQELRQQRAEWQAAAERAGDNDDPSRGQQQVRELTEQIAQQHEQLSAMRLQQAKVSATLERLRSQRGLLTARLKTVEASFRTSGLKRRRKAALSLMALVGVLTVVTGVWFFLDRRLITANAKSLFTKASQFLPWDQTGPMPLAVAENHFEPPTQRFKGNTGMIDGLAFSPDDRWLYGGGRNGRVIVWDRETGRSLYEDVNRASIGHLAVHPLTGRVWSDRAWWTPDLSGGQQEFQWLSQIQLTADPKLILGIGYGASFQNRPLLLYNVEAAAVVEAIAEKVGQVVTAPQANMVVYSSNQDQALHVWSLNDRKELGVIKRPQFDKKYSPVFVVSPDGRQLALYQHSGRIRSPGNVEVWELPSGKMKVKHAVRGGNLTQMAFQPGTGMLAVCSGTLIELWDIEQQLVRKQFQGRSIYSIAFSTDGRLLAGGGGSAEDPMCVLWDALPEAIETTGDPRVLPGFGPAVFSQDGQHYWSMDKNDLVRRSLSDGLEIQRVGVGGNAIPPRLIISPDEHHAVFSERHGRTAQGIDQSRFRIVDLNSGKEASSQLVPSTQAPGIFSADGADVFYVNDEELIRWNVSSGETHSVAKFLGAWQKHSMAVSPDGALIAIGGWSQDLRTAIVQVYSLHDGKLSGEWSDSDTSIKAIAFSPDSARLIWCARTEVIEWDVVKREVLARIPTGRSITPETLAVSPVGGKLAVCGSGLPISIWSLSSGRRILALQPNSELGAENQTICFTQDGRYLLTSAPGKPVVLYDCDSLTPSLKP